MPSNGTDHQHQPHHQDQKQLCLPPGVAHVLHVARRGPSGSRWFEPSSWLFRCVKRPTRSRPRRTQVAQGRPKSANITFGAAMRARKPKASMMEIGKPHTTTLHAEPRHAPGRCAWCAEIAAPADGNVGPAGRARPRWAGGGLTLSRE